MNENGPIGAILGENAPIKAILVENEPIRTIFGLNGLNRFTKKEKSVNLLENDAFAGC